MFICIGRKLVAYTLGLMLMLATTVLPSTPTTISVRRYYRLVEYRMKQLWATCYIALACYAVIDVFQNLDDFLNCKENTTPRPIGIFSAVALACFVFTTKLSVSSLSIVAMYCAKDANMLTGLAAMVCFSVWTDIDGSSVIVCLCTILTGLVWVFCRQRSNAFLFFVSLAWLLAWAWLAIVGAAMQTFKLRWVPKHE